MADANGSNGEKKAYRWVIAAMLGAGVAGAGAGAKGNQIWGDHGDPSTELRLHADKIADLKEKDREHDNTLKDLNKDVSEIKGDVKWIRRTITKGATND